MGWLSILPVLIGMVQLFVFGQAPLNLEGAAAQRQLTVSIQQNLQFAQILERESGRQHRLAEWNSLPHLERGLGAHWACVGCFQSAWLIYPVEKAPI